MTTRGCRALAVCGLVLALSSALTRAAQAQTVEPTAPEQPEPSTDGPAAEPTAPSTRGATDGAETESALGPDAGEPTSSMLGVPAAVRALLPACPLYDAEELGRLLRVELGSLGVEQTVIERGELASEPLPHEAALIRVGCDEPAEELSLQLADLATGKALERVVPVRDVEPTARPRLLAMAAAGLLESSWSELLSGSHGLAVRLPARVREALRRRLATAVEASPRAEPEPAVPPVVEDPKPRASLELSGVVRAFPARFTGVAGLGAGYAHLALPALRLWLDLDGQLGAHELSDSEGRLASMRLYWIAAGAGVSFVAKGTPELAIGPFARGGYAVARSVGEREGYRGQTATGPVSALGLRADLSAALSPTWSALLSLEGGYMPSGVVFIAARNRAAGMAEVVLALRIGMRLAL